MANTYTQIHIQTVFAVKNLGSLIQDKWKDELYKYMCGIIQTQEHKVLQINGMPDHIHILIGLRPSQSLSDLMKLVKRSSANRINEKNLAEQQFSWQAGFGAFSYSKSQVPRVIKYIQNQQKHHKKQTFHDEYIELLKAHDLDFEERYIFQSIV